MTAGSKNANEGDLETQTLRQREDVSIKAGRARPHSGALARACGGFMGDDGRGENDDRPAFVRRGGDGRFDPGSGCGDVGSAKFETRGGTGRSCVAVGLAIGPRMRVG